MTNILCKCAKCYYGDSQVGEIKDGWDRITRRKDIAITPKPSTLRMLIKFMFCTETPNLMPF